MRWIGFNRWILIGKPLFLMTGVRVKRRARQEGFGLERRRGRAKSSGDVGHGRPAAVLSSLPGAANTSETTAQDDDAACVFCTALEIRPFVGISDRLQR